MARTVIVNADQVVLPDGLVYNEGDTPTLSRSQFDQIPSHLFNEILTDGGQNGSDVDSDDVDAIVQSAITDLIDGAPEDSNTLGKLALADESIIFRPGLLHVTNIDISQPHPFGAYFPTNTIFCELVGQTNPAENGTYATTGDPTNDPLVASDIQVLSATNTGRPVVFTTIVSGWQIWNGSHEFFVGSDPSTSQPILSFQQGCSTIATVVQDENPAVGFDASGGIATGGFVLVRNSTTKIGKLWVFVADNEPLVDLALYTGPGVSVHDPLSFDTWTVNLAGEWNMNGAP